MWVQVCEIVGVYMCEILRDCVLTMICGLVDVGGRIGRLRWDRTEEYVVACEEAQ